MRIRSTRNERENFPVYPEKDPGQAPQERGKPVGNSFERAATRELLATDHVILNHGQVTWTTPELAPPLLTTTPHQREDVSALDRFNVHRCPTRRVFSGTEIELNDMPAMVGYLNHWATAALRKVNTQYATINVIVAEVA
ncbi:uncharacterized protein TNCV_4068231 [Trichonephila clavipes]|nr:uncharacterized protein TNCV_4068231 [Trichonephila clavipes]